MVQAIGSAARRDNGRLDEILHAPRGDRARIPSTAHRVPSRTGRAIRSSYAARAAQCRAQAAWNARAAREATHEHARAGFQQLGAAWDVLAGVYDQLRPYQAASRSH